MKLVHSFHYFEESVKIKNGRIVDLKTGNAIQVLTNLCRDREIFTPVIEKVLSKKKVYRIIDGFSITERLTVISVIIQK